MTGERVGAVFDPEDEGSIARAVRALVEGAGALSAMSSRARELAETRYNWEIEKTKLIGLYDRLAIARSTS